MPDTLLVITRTEAIFMASPKKGAHACPPALPPMRSSLIVSRLLVHFVPRAAALLATLQTGAANAVPLRIVERQKTDSFDTKFDEVLTIVKGSGSVVRAPPKAVIPSGRLLIGRHAWSLRCSVG